MNLLVGLVKKHVFMCHIQHFVILIKEKLMWKGIFSICYTLICISVNLLINWINGLIISLGFSLSTIGILSGAL